MASILDLKKKGNRLEELRAKAKQSSTSGGNEKDDRFWQPTVDDNMNGMAVIRFMPEPPAEDLAWVKLYARAFKGPTSGKWYINNCRSTIGENDPVGELATRLWNSGIESDKDVSRLIKRKLSYISNIYVVDDPANPENNGKVFLFKYGKKIFDMLNLAMNPEFKDEQAIDPFNLWTGANFRIKIRKVEGYRNYDKSSFDAPAPLFADDKVIEKHWNKCHSLAEHVAVNKFKTYAELQTELSRCLGTVVGSGIATVEGMSPPTNDNKPAAAAKSRKPVPAPEAAVDDTPPWDDAPVMEKAAPVTKQKTTTKKAAAVVEDDDADLAAFMAAANA